jgi:hypothetical protein
VSQTQLEELVPQLPDNLADKKAILQLSREIVKSYWKIAADPTLAMALQIVVQLPAQRHAALAALDALEQAVEQQEALAA